MTAKTSASSRKASLPVPWPTTVEAAIPCGVSPATVGEWLRRGWLTGARVGRRWRVDPASIEKVMREGTPKGSMS